MSSSTSVCQRNLPVFRQSTASCSCGCPRLTNSNVCSSSVQSTDTGIGLHPLAASSVSNPMALIWSCLVRVPSTLRHMHAGPLPRVPLAADRALDLRGQLQQQPVIGLLCDRLD